MPTQLTRRISTRTKGLAGKARTLQRKATQDIGRCVRDLARANAPKKSGELRQSIVVGPVQQTAKTTYVEVDSALPKARWHEEGTGIYGPRKRRIVPVHAKALAWRSQGGPAKYAGVGSQQVARGIRLRAGKVAKYKPRDVYINFAQSVRGIPPVHFLARAFHSSQAQAYHRQRVAEMGQDIRALVRGAA